jgi:hypothetical protein
VGVYEYLYRKHLKMKKFSINDEVYQAGKFGLRIALFVWKINRNTDGTVTYTCSTTKGRDEQVYTDKEIYFLADLY